MTAFLRPTSWTLRLRRIAAVAGLMMAGLAPAPATAQAPGAGAPQGPREVGVMELKRETVPLSVTLPGRAVAYQETGIRPQVGGEIVEIAYQPGVPVEAGTVLFRINDDQLAATLSAAEAAVVSAEAAVQGATATVGRYDRLQGTGVSRAELETAEVALANARASLAAAEAERALAQLAVDRTEIRSPIDGIPDIATVSVGDLVTASQSDALTTVTQFDPIYVDVSDSRARILRNREQRAQGTLVRTQGPEAQLVLETGQVYPHAGRFVAPGRQVSPTTGTVPFRLEFPNPRRLILPSQFVRVQMPIGAVEGVLVPQGPTRRSATGQLTAFLARDGRAEEVLLTEAGTYQSSWIVTEGVEEGDLLILDGLTNLGDGDEITTIPVTIDPDGVVREVADGGETAGQSPAPDAAAAAAETGAVMTAPAEAAAGPETGPSAAAAPAADLAESAADGGMEAPGAAQAAVADAAPAARPLRAPAQTGATN